MKKPLHSGWLGGGESPLDEQSNGGNDMIEISYVKNEILNGYKCRISVYDGNQYLYSENSRITRLNISDAIKDAEFMKADILGN